MLDQCWVIRNADGYYVNVRGTKKGYFYTLYTGLTSGFTFYTSKKKMEDDLGLLGEGFYYQYINLNNIGDGERIHF